MRNPARGQKSSDPISQSKIPTYTPDQVQTIKVRYYVDPSSATDAVNFAIELPQVPNALATSSSILYQLYKAVRLAKVEMWCNYRPGNDIDGNTINLTVVERRTVRPIEYSDTATPVYSAHIKKKFSNVEPLGLWYSTTVGETNPELRFQMGKGSILELTFCVIYHDSEAVPVFGSSGMTFPRIYTNRLNANVSCIGKSYQTVMTI